MKIIQQARELGGPGRPVCLAIGMFDGVHLGHQRVLGQTMADAKAAHGWSVAITFDQHPNVIVAPDRTPPLIYSLPQRLRVIASLGIEATLLIRFDQAFSRQTGEAFVRALAHDFGQIQSVCIGENFTFGYRRSGTVALLKQLGQELGFLVHDLAAVSWDGKTISSTRLREDIQAGALTDVSQMLGRPYSVAGEVRTGDRLGRQLGFPTANLDVTRLVLPPNGVYSGQAHVRGERHQAVANIGYRPTLNPAQPERRFEVHLLDFDDDLYGLEMEFAFQKRLRGEEKFPSLDALKEQITRDVVAARAACA
jgi:riboflavin kinase/FMN adenylyltransferase